MKHLFETTASGGRKGPLKSVDSVLDFKLKMPTQLSGEGRTM